MPIDQSLQRYAPHLALPQIGVRGQRAIGEASVLLIGLGGLGGVAGQYLASCGLGELLLCDHDRVAESNLSRQLLYSAADIGRPKVEAAEEALARINPGLKTRLLARRMDQASIAHLLPDCDLVIDASDNYGTRLAVNRACLEHGTPWVMGSCIRMEGQLKLFAADRPAEPCYRCVYGTAPETLEDCPGAGVFAPVAGVIGAAMAHLALLRIVGLETSGALHVLDAAAWSWRAIATTPRADCPDCADRPRTPQNP